MTSADKYKRDLRMGLTLSRIALYMVNGEPGPWISTLTLALGLAMSYCHAEYGTDKEEMFARSSKLLRTTVFIEKEGTYVEGNESTKH